MSYFHIRSQNEDWGAGGVTRFRFGPDTSHFDLKGARPLKIIGGEGWRRWSNPTLGDLPPLPLRQFARIIITMSISGVYRERKTNRYFFLNTTSLSSVGSDRAWWSGDFTVFFSMADDLPALRWWTTVSPWSTHALTHRAWPPQWAF